MKFTLSRPSTASIVLFVFAAGMLAQSVINRVGAHGGDPSLIHTCVKTSNGSFRFVGENELCNSNETAVDWPKTGGSGIGAFGGFTTNQLINMVSSGDTLDYRYFAGANFTNSTFSGGNMRFADFTGANFTNTVLQTDARGSNFTNANFTGAQLVGQGFPDANVSNANFTNANLSGSDFENAITVGAVWSNTTCPDGTNSDANGNTCEGHLVP